jgi:hypothetical protein
VRYWFDRETRVWWAARYDAAGNQIGDAVHAATRDGIRAEIDACLTPPSLDSIRRDRKVNSVLDERAPGDGSEDGGGNGIWAYLQPGWRCTLADSHACHEYTVEALANAVRWAEPCPCEDCQKTPKSP